MDDFGAVAGVGVGVVVSAHTSYSIMTFLCVRTGIKTHYASVLWHINMQKAETNQYRRDNNHTTTTTTTTTSICIYGRKVKRVDNCRKR